MLLYPDMNLVECVTKMVFFLWFQVMFFPFLGESETFCLELISLLRDLGMYTYMHTLFVCQ